MTIVNAHAPKNTKDSFQVFKINCYYFCMMENNNHPNSSSQIATAQDKTYWENRYEACDIPWDMGQVSPPFKAYIDQLTHKTMKILIPGCGNAYEAAYLLKQGFSNITIIDIVPQLVQELKNKMSNNSTINIIPGDFFDHTGKYDLILEQTFFCAIHPAMRHTYVTKMHGLLAEGGKLVGILFNKTFEEAGPPFGGNATEYRPLFDKYFKIIKLEPCYNSHGKRDGNELFLIAEKIQA